MLQDSFIETHVKRDNGIYGKLFIVFSIIVYLFIVFVLNAIPIVLGYNIIYVTGIISFGLAYLLYIIIKRQNIEYEIEIVNDDFSVARIFDKKKREELANFSLRECDYIGPTTSDRFTNDLNDSDFTLNVTENKKVLADEKIWYTFVNQNGTKYIVAFEFNDDMYPVFRRYNPRNVAFYVVPKKEDIKDE